ncbi:MAG: hypothetical protein ACRDZ7_09630 [Acidimicrobiia bacterium]
MQPAPDPPDPPERRSVASRRWRRFAGGALLVASVASLLWWNRAVTADPGLEFNGGTNVFRAAPGDMTGITRLENTLGTEARIEFEPGGTFMAFFGLHNGGSRSVRIEEVAPQGFFYWGFDGVAVSADERTVFPEGARETFRPFTLAAGETRYVRADFRLANCQPTQSGGFSTVNSLPVTYKVLGFRRTVRVPFDQTELTVEAMGDCDKPIPPRR